MYADGSTGITSIVADTWNMAQFTVAQLASLCGGEVQGDGNRLITGASTLEQATGSDIAFAETSKAFGPAGVSNAGCIVVPTSFDLQTQAATIRVGNPRQAFSKLLGTLYPARHNSGNIHPTAIIAPSAKIGSNCSVGAYVTIEDGVSIAEACLIAAGCHLGQEVTIGEHTTLHPNVTVYEKVRIGARVTLHAGCVIGADGFGYTFTDGRFEKFPQVGTVQIEDDVELGANCCVDRAALGVTRIRKGAKLDNLVHVAHNCDIGQHVAVAAQTGFSGSVTVGDYAMIGGQTGIGEKARIDPKSIVGGKAGILTGQHIEAGEPVWGIPARPLKQHLRGLAHIARLPKTEGEVKEIRKRLSELEQRVPE